MPRNQQPEGTITRTVGLGGTVTFSTNTFGPVEVIGEEELERIRARFNTRFDPRIPPIPPPRFGINPLLKKRKFKTEVIDSVDTFTPGFLKLPNSKITLGLDAEFIIRDKTTNLPVSMIDKIGGTKRKPLKIPYGALQEDGVLAEINIDPARTLFEWERNITTVLKCLSAVVSKFNCYIDYNSITAEYPVSEMKDHRAWEAGCDPDYNCWTEEKNLSKEFTSTLRTCGGHIHVGWKGINSFNPDFRNKLARTLDYYVGVPLFFYEPQNKRRQLYGAPGAFRPKPYGVELRTPSNYWLKNSTMRKYVFFLLCHALDRDFVDTWDGYDSIYTLPFAESLLEDRAIGLNNLNNSLKDFYCKDITIGTVNRIPIGDLEIKHV